MKISTYVLVALAACGGRVDYGLPQPEADSGPRGDSPEAEVEPPPPDSGAAEAASPCLSEGLWCVAAKGYPHQDRGLACTRDADGRGSWFAFGATTSDQRDCCDVRAEVGSTCEWRSTLEQGTVHP